MLEKILGCSLITKLRSILLMEADFNTSNKVNYGVRMLANVRKYKLIPEEVYSKMNCLADDGTLSKVLFYDIVWQLWRLAGLRWWMQITATIALPIPWHQWSFKSLAFQHRQLNQCSQQSRTWSFFLRTRYGNSANYAGDKSKDTVDPVKTQGMCQGNTAAPPRIDSDKHPNDRCI